MEYDLDEYDYLMVFRPHKDEGEMYLNVQSIIPENDHPEGWPEFVIFSMLLMSTAYAMMEEDEELRKKVMARLEADAEKMQQEQELQQPAPRYSKADGSNVIKLTAPRYSKADGSNVIKLTPFTKTKGNA